MSEAKVEAEAEADSSVTVAEADSSVAEAEADSSVTVAGNANCLHHIKSVLSSLAQDQEILNRGIYTVPPRFQSTANDDALCPRIVSLGHFHNGMPGLLAMQEQKFFYLLFLLHRTKHPQTTLGQCCKAISNSRKFKMYAQYFMSDLLSDEKLVEILLIDGCFVLELLLRFSYPDMVKDDSKDPIFKNTWFMPTLQHDLLLLQNQVPMFVLKILVENIQTVSLKAPFSSNGETIELKLDSVCSLAHNFFRTIVLTIIHPPDPSITEKSFHSKRLHFLDMLHDAFEPPDHSKNRDDDHTKVPIPGEGEAVEPPDHSKNRDDDHTKVPIPGEGDAIEPPHHFPGEGEIPKLGHFTTQKLLAAGVKIEKAENKHLLDLSFEDKTLRIPKLLVDLNTWSVLKNLVVWEQCSVDQSHHVTSYAVVLKNLIRTTRDVELLVEKKILKNKLDGPESVVAFVDSIFSGTVIRDFTYQKMFDALNAHRDPWWRWRKLMASWKLSWHKYKLALVTDYFPDPWRVVQFVVAFVLLALTALQTFYTVIPYY